MFWRNLKVWPVGAGKSCHTASSHFSFHWIRAAAVSTVLAPHNISFRQTCQIRPLAHLMEWVTPFEFLSKSALSASECRKTLCPWRQPEGLGRGSPILPRHSSSVNLLHVLLPSRHGCVSKCDSPASRIVDRLFTKKVTFLKNYWVFLQAIFYDVTADPREHFKVVWFIFWPVLPLDAILINATICIGKRIWLLLADQRNHRPPLVICLSLN